MSKEATRIYSTWFSGLSAGYWERSGGAARVGARGSDFEAREECGERDIEDGDWCSFSSFIAS
jgi:hypothetical protein